MKSVDGGVEMIPTQSWSASLTAVGRVEPLTTVLIFFLILSTSVLDREVNWKEGDTKMKIKKKNKTNWANARVKLHSQVHFEAKNKKFWVPKDLLTCTDLTCPDLTCADLTCPNLTCPDLTCPDYLSLFD